MSAEILTIRPGADDADWPAAVSNCVLDVVRHLTAWGAGGTTRATVVLECEDAASLVTASTRKALRSLVHASTLENRRLAVNLVVAPRGHGDLDATLNFLHGAGAGFVRGTTVDLAEAP